MINMHFNDAIKKSREQLGISQEAAAKEIERLYPGVRISGPYLSMIENGTKSNLTTKLVKALLDFYKLPAYFATSLLIDNSDDSNIPASLPPTGDPMNDLPPEALQEIEEFKAFVRHKYQDYYQNKVKEKNANASK